MSKLNPGKYVSVKYNKKDRKLDDIDNTIRIPFEVVSENDVNFYKNNKTGVFKNDNKKQVWKLNFDGDCIVVDSESIKHPYLFLDPNHYGDELLSFEEFELKLLEIWGIE